MSVKENTIFKMNNHAFSKKKIDIVFASLLCVYALIWIILTYSRINNNAFWGDEAWTINFSNYSFGEIARMTANDVHPPLYYWIVKILVMIFGATASVYRLASWIAYVALLLISLTYIRKDYGVGGSFLFITFASILGAPAVQSVEARMYECAILFVLIAFLSFKSILDNNDIRSYILYGVFVSAAAYTHYYALVVVGLLSFGLFLFAIIHRDYLKKTIICGICVGLSYLPWALSLYRTFRRTKNDYWISSIPNFRDCIRFIFKVTTSSDEKKLWEVILLIALFVSIAIILKNSDKTNDKWWVMVGIFSVIFTAIVGIVVSNIFRPMFQIKYMYPSIAIAWVILIFGISKLKYTDVINLILGIVTIFVCINTYDSRIQLEDTRNSLVESTMSQITPLVKEGDIIINDNDASTPKLLSYYFLNHTNYDVPAISSDCFDEPEHDYWIVSNSEYDPTNIYLPNDYHFEQVINNGMIGTDYVNVYHIFK